MSFSNILPYDLTCMQVVNGRYLKYSLPGFLKVHPQSLRTNIDARVKGSSPGVMPRRHKGTKQHEGVPDVPAEQMKAPHNATNSRRHEKTQASSRCPQHHDPNNATAYGSAQSRQDICYSVRHDDTI